jgi:hypothetical protein
MGTDKLHKLFRGGRFGVGVGHVALINVHIGVDDVSNDEVFEWG